MWVYIGEALKLIVLWPRPVTVRPEVGFLRSISSHFGLILTYRRTPHPYGS